MKKIILPMMFILLFVTSILCINAATAKAPSVVPSEGDKLYADTDEEFDFSAISFSTVPEGARVTGSKTMKKIMLSSGLNSNGSLDDNWFTAYCLNGMMKYPLAFVKGMPDILDETLLRNAAVVMLYKDSSLYNLFAPYLDNYYYTTTGATIDEETVNNYNSGNSVTISLASITFYKESEIGSITSAQINEAKGISGSDEYSVTFSKNDINQDIYTAINMPDSLYYNRALWIIEHSYPTLSLEVSLKDAGADYNKLLEEVKALHIGYTDAQVAEMLEKYVYSTVQYAIWRSEDGFKQNINGTTYALGDTLYGSEELNKLYKYLIKDRDVYLDYDSVNYDNKLEVVKPAEGKEIFRENNDSYVFGPYSIKTSLISIGDANVSIGNKTKTGLSIVDKAGNKISSVGNEEEFYVKVMKNASVGSVSVKISTNNGLKFENSSNRGRLYSPTNFAEQTVASGGKVVNASASVDLDIIVNAKTGTQDVLMIVLIGFVAFTIGYVVLRYKGEALELN